MPLGTQKFRTGGNLFHDASIIDLPCVQTATPLPTSGLNNVREANYNTDIVQDPLSLFTNPSGTRVGLNSSHTYEIRVVNITDAKYERTPDTNTKSLSGTESNPTGIRFNTDGTKMFLVGPSDNVNEYHLTTGFDPSTASFDSSFDTGIENPSDLVFNTDGTKMFIISSADSVIEYHLSTGFDVSTASQDSSFLVRNDQNNPTGIAFNTDGTKMFVTGPSDSVSEYHLSTGFDVSTASHDSNFATGLSNPTGVNFSTDGKQMFLTSPADTVTEFSLSTGYDVSTATLVDSFLVRSETENPSGFCFSTNGLKLFVIGPNDSVVTYSLVKAFDLISPFDYANLVITFGLHTGFTSDASTPFFRPPSTYDFVFQTNDPDTDADDNFYDSSTTNIGIFDGSTWNSAATANMTLTNIKLPFLLKNVTVASGTSRFFSTEWHIASGTNQILPGPTVRLMIRKTS